MRVDPEKDKQISAAREWALNFIDDNAGGVKFSSEARAQLLREPLDYSQPLSRHYGYDGSYDYGSDKPTPAGPSPEPPSKRPP